MVNYPFLAPVPNCNWYLCLYSCSLQGSTVYIFSSSKLKLVTPCRLHSRIMSSRLHLTKLVCKTNAACSCRTQVY